LLRAFAFAKMLFMWLLTVFGLSFSESAISLMRVVPVHKSPMISVSRGVSW